MFQQDLSRINWILYWTMESFAGKVGATAGLAAVARQQQKTQQNQTHKTQFIDFKPAYGDALDHPRPNR